MNKCMWWMPWRLQAKKDVVACEKLRGVGKQALIRRYPNGATQPAMVIPVFNELSHEAIAECKIQ